MIVWQVVEAQTLTNTEVARIQTTVYDFFYAGRTEFSKLGTPDTKSEALIFMLGVDSSGRISEVNLLSDSENRDSAFLKMDQLNPTHFSSWIAKKAAGKTILIPFMVMGNSNKPAYVKSLAGKYVLKPGEMGNLIILPGLKVSWPIRSHSPSKNSVPIPN